MPPFLAHSVDLSSNFFLFVCEALDESISADEISVPESLQYDFDTLCIATDNFSDTNKLGRGGFGVVYKVIEDSNPVEFYLF